jgi:EAL domain-containing protein (putative c-di-GMP-specific phosphodiesterase class I)
VLSEACRQAASWPGPEIGVAVNVSARNIGHHDFVSRVSASLHESGLHPHRLTLELTESAIMADPDGWAESLREITDLGVRLSIDDFGTGSWPIGHLLRLPAQTLKIDPGISAAIEHDSVASSVVAALVAMAHALGLRVIAEGVERPEQASLLASLGCDAAQGHLFGRPAAGAPSWR